MLIPLSLLQPLSLPRYAVRRPIATGGDDKSCSVSEFLGNQEAQAIWYPPAQLKNEALPVFAQYLLMEQRSLDWLRQRGQRILPQLAEQDRQNAYALLETCKIETTRQRLLDWLAAGWLTAYGLLYLERLLGWREIESLLCWVHPHFQAENETIARTIGVQPDTLKEYLKNAKQKLEQHEKLTLYGRGAQMVALDWAVKKGVIDPYK